MKIALGSVAVVAVPLVGLLLLSSFFAFIRPATITYADAWYQGDALTRYCTYWAVQTTPSGKPLPVLCDASPISSRIHFTPTITHYDGDKYAWGNCTYWAALRRAQTGNPIPNTWSDATYWASRARADGYTVDHTPTVGAIMQTSGGIGHVAFVEAVSKDGSWRISEMNARGFNVVDYRTLSASAAALYSFIH